MKDLKNKGKILKMAYNEEERIFKIGLFSWRVVFDDI